MIDPRTLAPLDTQTILESVDKTGRLVLVDQATRHASAATVIAGEVAEHGFSSLKAPIVQVTALDATIPYSEPLEAWVLPDEDKIVAAVQQVLGLGARDGVGRDAARRRAGAGACSRRCGGSGSSRSGSDGSSAPTRCTG